MVAIHEKEVTHRSAVAEGVIKFSNSESMKLLLLESNKKGDVISIARIAGIMAVKKTAELIPLCHPISITGIKVDMVHNEKENSVKVTCEVHCDGKTGVEMEALTGATVTLLTVYDMCKAVDKMMTISDCRVVKKSGGKSGDIDVSQPPSTK
ncbi:hypothetical protein KL930_002781 [Ogataea haglerorum]|uniref:cyclic pyranopterin monophosphate synthase n=1 Tax=Ogataea haglerorum TaxID=1937702 RepID=A0AAN6D7F3_9ASCO|nr:uncharacterized protein KL911_002961 [Ogataea haglerorum]KAG7691870.1 hypothetical protein KL915_004933 [Ogataea haglerorum]KAG7692696.1 hypothetical protein KL951_004943 [Ogataea haglerorum]KAG7702915.1 hypothetical protein KL950_004993 [Ogataea haglerorum]KAG7703014.1 hypothetical protein KL914_005019 [Ogataea haglerorum]KAG7718937.1 hypothetical protein KL913_001935 [Ogataea haglerorum]